MIGAAMKKILLVVLLVLPAFAGGCAQTIEVLPTPTVEPSETPTPTSTPAATSTVTPTETPSPTPTPAWYQWVALKGDMEVSFPPACVVEQDGKALTAVWYGAHDGWPYYAVASAAIVYCPVPPDPAPEAKLDAWSQLEGSVQALVPVSCQIWRDMGTELITLIPGGDGYYRFTGRAVLLCPMPVPMTPPAP